MTPTDHVRTFFPRAVSLVRRSASSPAAEISLRLLIDDAAFWPRVADDAVALLPLMLLLRKLGADDAYCYAKDTALWIRDHRPRGRRGRLMSLRFGEPSEVGPTIWD